MANWRPDNVMSSTVMMAPAPPVSGPGWDMGAINAGRTLVLRAAGAELSRAGVSFTNDFVGAAPPAPARPGEA